MLSTEAGLNISPISFNSSLCGSLFLPQIHDCSAYQRFEFSFFWPHLWLRTVASSARVTFGSLWTDCVIRPVFAIWVLFSRCDSINTAVPPSIPVGSSVSFQLSLTSSFSYITSCLVGCLTSVGLWMSGISNSDTVGTVDCPISCLFAVGVSSSVITCGWSEYSLSMDATIIAQHDLVLEHLGLSCLISEKTLHLIHGQILAERPVGDISDKRGLCFAWWPGTPHLNLQSSISQNTECGIATGISVSMVNILSKLYTCFSPYFPDLSMKAGITLKPGMLWNCFTICSLGK